MKPYFRRFDRLLAVVLSLLLFVSLTPIRAEESEIAMFRLYNPNSGEHFYTAQAHEKDYLVQAGWRYEGIGWFAPADGTPVWRLYNPNAGDHHYTIQDHERAALISIGWKDEGMGWYSDPQLRVPLYREYNPNAKTGTHNYTTSRHEHEAIVSMGWIGEGIGWYGLKEGQPVEAPALGRLHVQGSQLVDENNQPVVLQGFSTFGLNYAPQYVNENVFAFLKNTMHSQIIRLAMYTEESGGYCSGGDPSRLKALIDKGVQAARATGQYVIIDWHILSDGNPNRHLNEAREFFREMSAKYKNETHVFYEICNEPNGVSWPEIKRYASQIIPVIRANDPQGVILVGTPTWSQDVDVAAASPLSGVSNVMYTLHFYAATHKDSIRSKLRAAHGRGLPVFVSEFGISSADGNGTLDEASGNAWISLLNKEGISRVGWAINNKNEASSLFVPGSSLNLSVSDLSPSGRWFYRTYSKKPVDPVITPPQTPGFAKVEAQCVNTWTSGSEAFYQYSITISNPGGSDLDGWSAILNFNRSFAIDSGWSAGFSAEGERLTITPVDWNASLAAGALVENIGVILRCPADGTALSVR